jgi:hypothetical protein
MWKCSCVENLCSFRKTKGRQNVINRMVTILIRYFRSEIRQFYYIFSEKYANINSQI